MLYQIAVTAAVTILAIGLSIGLRRILPLIASYIGSKWLPLVVHGVQAVILVGGLGLIFYLAGLRTAVEVLAVALSFAAGLTLSTGNGISDRLATLRIKRLAYYQVGDEVTVSENIRGTVEKITDLNTVISTEAQERIWVCHSEVIRNPIVVHSSSDSDISLQAPIMADKLGNITEGTNEADVVSLERKEKGISQLIIEPIEGGVDDYIEERPPDAELLDIHHPVAQENAYEIEQQPEPTLDPQLAQPPIPLYLPDIALHKIPVLKPRPTLGHLSVQALKWVRHEMF